MVNPTPNTYPPTPQSYCLTLFASIFQKSRIPAVAAWTRGPPSSRVV